MNPASTRSANLIRRFSISADWAARAVDWLRTAAAAECAGTDLSLRDEDVRRKIGLVEDV